jgi:hypothetical protein
VNADTLAHWKYKLVAEARKGARAASPPSVEFVEVTEKVTAAQRREAPIEVCRGDWTVRVPRDFDAVSLERLFDVLERR